MVSSTAFTARAPFPGNRAQDAYFVRCGLDTMGEDDIEQGRLIVLVGIAPLRPSEFVILRIGMWLCGDDD